MHPKRIEGNKIANHLLEIYRQNVTRLKEIGIQPKLAVVSLGSNPASRIYVKQKEKKARMIGMEFEWRQADVTISGPDLKALLAELNRDAEVNGIMLEMPLPSHLSANQVGEWIDPLKDVDGLHPLNLGKLITKTPVLYPATPHGIMRLFEIYGVRLSGKKVCMIGKSQIVGMPLAVLMSHNEGTVTLCHTLTPRLADYTLEADIIVVAAGVPTLVTADMVKEGAVVIDVGINQLSDGSIVGDADYEALMDKVALISPVPGGVGPMTVAMLMEQTLIATCLQHQLDPSDYIGGEPIEPRQC